MHRLPNEASTIPRFAGREKIAGLLAPAAAALLVLGGAAGAGPGLSADSAVYLSVAESLRSGAGFGYFGGSPYVSGPPLYPTLLAALPGALAPPHRGIAWLNAASFALVVAVAARLWRARGISSGWIVAGLAALLFSAPLLGVFLFAWTEAPFIAICAAFLAAADRFQKDGGAASLGALWAAASLGCLTRYSGVSLVVAGASLVLLDPARRVGRRFGLAAAFSLAALAPLALWLARNHAVTGTPVGERGPSVFGITEALGQISATVAGWLGLGSAPAPLRYGAVGALCIACVLAWRRRPAAGAGGASVATGQHESTAQVVESPAARVSAGRAPARHASTVMNPAEGSCGSHPALVPSVFTVAYAGALLGAVATAGFDRIDDRLLSPLFLPVLTLVLMGTKRVLDTAERMTLARSIRRLVAAGTIIWLTGCAVRIVRLEWNAWSDGAGGYATASWRASGLAAHLRVHPPDGTLLSNEPAVPYLLAGTVAGQAPRRTLYHSTKAASGDLIALERLLAGGTTVYLAWFDRIEAPHLLPPDDLGRRYRLEAAHRAPDGTLYRLGSR